jgi:hypothetical protein
MRGLSRQGRPNTCLGIPSLRRRRRNERNGTQSLFACLSVQEGDVLAMPSKTRNRWDLIRFLDHLDEEIPVLVGQQIVAITDNLSTRGTEEVNEWLQAHPRCSFQFTPKHASWLNQREIFFSILGRGAAQARDLHQRARPRAADARVRGDLQPGRQAVQVDLHRQGSRSMRARINRMNH